MYTWRLTTTKASGISEGANSHWSTNGHIYLHLPCSSAASSFSNDRRCDPPFVGPCVSGYLISSTTWIASKWSANRQVCHLSLLQTINRGRESCVVSQGSVQRARAWCVLRNQTFPDPVMSPGNTRILGFSDPWPSAGVSIQPATHFIFLPSFSPSHPVCQIEKLLTTVVVSALVSVKAEHWSLTFFTLIRG